MKHIVNNKADVIFDGVIYKPDNEGNVDLPGEMITDNVKPVGKSKPDNEGNDSGKSKATK